MCPQTMTVGVLGAHFEFESPYATFEHLIVIFMRTRIMRVEAG